MKRTCLGWFLVLFSPFTFGFDFEGGSIIIPDDYVGPMQFSKGQTTYISFILPHGDFTATLLQINITEGTESTDASLSQSLDQSVAAVEARRTGFATEGSESITISSVPALRATWTGGLDDVSMHGVMYSLIHDGRVYSLHVQDNDAYEGKYVDQVASAIESLELSGTEDTDSGDTDTGTGDGSTDSGDTDAGTGDGSTDSGDTDTGTGDGSTDSGDTDTGTGDGSTDSGDTDTGTGDGSTDSGDTDTGTGDGSTDSGDTDTGDETSAPPPRSRPRGQGSENERPRRSSARPGDRNDHVSQADPHRALMPPQASRESPDRNRWQMD